MQRDQFVFSDIAAFISLICMCVWCLCMYASVFLNVCIHLCIQMFMVYICDYEGWKLTLCLLQLLNTLYNVKQALSLIPDGNQIFFYFG